MRREGVKAEKPRSRFGDRVMLRWSIGRYVDGLWIGNYSGNEAQAAPALRRVEDALDLIRQHDPIQYRRLLRDLERIWVRMVLGGLAEFNEALRACELDTRFVLADTTSAEQIATAIGHEAAHARLSRCGIQYRESLRPRIEAICMRREIAFASSLPNGDEVREQVERSLAFYAGPAYWTNAAFGERAPAEAREAFHYLGMPNALVRLFLITYAWRVAALRFFRSLVR